MTTDAATPAESAPRHTQLRALAQRLGLTVEAFAERVGASKRTLYKWEEAGCPFDSEEGLRAWAHFHRHRLRPPLPRADLADLHGAAAPATPAAPTTSAPQAGPAAEIAPGNPAGQGGGVPTPGPRDRLDERRASLVELQTRKLQAEVDEQDRVLVHRDLMIDGFGALGLAVVSELTGLDAALLAALPADFPAELRDVVRSAARQVAKAWRASLPALVRSACETALLGRPR
jgi:transcriptional regulator with XRE-family HTH domain